VSYVILLYVLANILKAVYKVSKL